MVALDSFYPLPGVTTQLAQWQKFAAYYFGDGVAYNALNGFSVAQHAPPGMSVDVATGQCFIQGVFGENGTVKTLTIAAADATNPRIDRVVLRLDTTNNDIEVLVITGVAAVSPAAPAVVRSATQTDYPLYQVLVGTTVTSIVTANLTDERQYASARGIPAKAVTAAGTLTVFSPASLTENALWCLVAGTTTITTVTATAKPGSLLLLSFTSTGCAVTTAGNLHLGRNYISGAANASLLLIGDASGWLEVARSGEQVPAHQYYGNPTGTVAAATLAAIVAADLPSYGSVTFGSLTQGAGVAYTQNSGRATQFGKLWQAHGQFTPTGTGTTVNAITLMLPSGVAFNLASGDQVGQWRIDQAAQFGGILGVGSGGTAVNFGVPTGSGLTFWGLTPNVTLNTTTTIWVSITAEIT